MAHHDTHANEGLPHGRHAEVKVQNRTQKFNAFLIQFQVLGNGNGSRLHIDTAIGVSDISSNMPHGADRRQEDVIYSGIGQLLHMAVNKFDRVTGLAYRQFLRQRNCIFIRRIRQKHVVAELRKVGKHHWEQTVNQECIRNANGFLSGVQLTCIAFGQESLRLLVECNVVEHILRKRFLYCILGTKPVMFRFCFFEVGLLECEKCYTICTGHREAGRYTNVVTVEAAESRHNTGVIADTPLQNNVVSDRLIANNLMQVVPHNGVAEACGNICFSGSGCFCRSNGSFNKDRTALSECCGLFCRQGHWSEFANRNIHPGSLFFHKGTGSGCTDFIHHEVFHFPVFQGNVFGVLPANFEDRVYLWVDIGSRLCLSGNFIADNICSEHSSDSGSAGARYTNGKKRNVSIFFEYVLKAGADGVFRVAGSAKVLVVYHSTIPV